MRRQRNSTMKVKAAGQCLLSVLLCGMLSGCLFRRQPATPAVAQTKTPSIYVPPPPPAEKLPPMEAKPPDTVTDVEPAEAAQVKPRKKPKRVVTPPPASVPAPTPAAATTTPVPAADAAPTEAAALGALASDGGADPKQQQDISGKIGAVDKRITDLPPATADREQKQIAKVRLFLKEASDALKGGDVEGAGILATKAELLLDDIAKE